MPATVCALIVDPSGKSVVVDITNEAGNNPTSYTAQHGASTHSFPVTISSTTEFHFEAPVKATLSVLRQGDEVAGPDGDTVTYPLSYGQSQTVRPSVDQLELLTAKGGLRKDDEDIWLPFSRLETTAGSPTEVNVTGSIVTVWSMPDASSTRVTATIDPAQEMQNWATFDALVYWANGAAGSGDVLFRFDHDEFAVGDDIGTPPATTTGVAFTAGSQDILALSTVASGIAVPTKALFLASATRIGGDASDTLSNAAFLAALVLRKAS